MTLNNRGLTIVELLVAALAAAIVLTAVGSFFVATVRFAGARDSQAYLERQGALIVDEMARQVRTATQPLTVSSCNGAGSLGVTNATGAYCFYQSGTRLLEDRTPAGGSTGTMDLLKAGAIVNMAAQQNADATPTFSTTLAPCGSAAGCRVTVTFQIGACLARSTAASDCNFMRFTTDLTRRNY